MDLKESICEDTELHETGSGESKMVAILRSIKEDLPNIAAKWLALFFFVFGRYWVQARATDLYPDKYFDGFPESL
jgi:hypothetical protein